MAAIVFIGAGNIGLPMLTRLVRAGHRVTAVDLKPERLKQAEAAGAATSSNAVSVVEGADTVISMVLTGADIKKIYIESGLIEKSRKDTLFIDCSTIDADSARTVNAAALSAGREMVDAPVSGGVDRAAAGTLTAMVGGTTSAFERARPFLTDMASAVHHMGSTGAGVATKLCNNLVTAISIAAVAEAFTLADRLKLDRQKLFDVMTTSSAKCWALDVLCPVPGPVPTAPSNFSFKAGGAASLLVKDLGATQQTGQNVGSPMPLGSAVLSLYTMLCNAGLGELDASAIIKIFNSESIA